MGIQGLLPLLKSIQKPTHLRTFAGQTLGVDAYGWLHRGTVACAIELAQQKPTRKHIEFALNRVRMLIHFGVKPYIVFDGDYLPSKAHTEKERASRRKESRRLGLDLLRANKLSQAQLELQKAVDVTPLMARELIDELKAMGVPYIVAPYEADSQLAYLENRGVINGILSEDSDLLVFGAKCLLTKLDQHGECVMVNRADFTACREVSLVGWTDKEFRMMAMLSGCDYLPGIDKMGLKTAYRLVRKYKNVERAIRTVQFDGKIKVPAGYLEAFTKAERTFLYQWVFCPQAKCLVNLNKVPTNVDLDTMPYIGKPVEAHIATGVATGDLDPNTKERLVVPGRQRYPAVRTSSIHTPGEKQGKSIEEFFKRTPLAELDPNSFTPSLSQQRLLESLQTTSWSASQAPPSRIPVLDRIAGTNPPSSAPQAARRAASDPWNTTRNRDSPKRQRLCSDTILAESINGSVGISSTSRFFQPNVNPSPSLRKISTQRKADDFNLWSDDSAMEAVAAMTASPKDEPAIAIPAPKKRKKLQVYMDVPESSNSTDASTKLSQCTNGTSSSNSSPADAETPATSFESSITTPQTTIVFTKSINANFAGLKSSFASKPSIHRQGTASRTRSAPHASRTTLPLQATPQKEVFDRLAKHSRLQREQEYGSEDARGEEEEEEEEVVPCSSPLKAADEIRDEEWRKQPPARSPASRTLARGSEDFMVPVSPASLGLEDEDADCRHRPKLDLGRFTFAG